MFRFLAPVLVIFPLLNVHAWHIAYGIMKQVYEDEEHFTVGLSQFMLPDPTAVPAAGHTMGLSVSDVAAYWMP